MNQALYSFDIVIYKNDKYFILKDILEDWVYQLIEEGLVCSYSLLNIYIRSSIELNPRLLSDDTYMRHSVYQDFKNKLNKLLFK